MADPVKFSISVDGEKSGEKWVGNFSAKPLLSHREELRRDAIKRELLGGTNPAFADQRALDQGAIFADLAVRVVDQPTWWVAMGGGLDTVDDNLIAAVYKECMRIQDEAIKAIKDRATALVPDLKKIVD